MFLDDRDFGRRRDREDIPDEGMLHPVMINLDIQADPQQPRIQR